MEPTPLSPHGRPEEPSAPEPAAEPSFADSTRETVASQPFVVRRILAKLIDFVLVGVVYWLIVMVLGAGAGPLVGAIVAAAYFFVCDGLDVDFMRRQSIGKKLIGLRVQRLGGLSMNVEASARRNWVFALVWFVEPAGPLLTLLLLLLLVIIFIYETYEVIIRSDGRRWGDQLAGTRVVSA
jgi:uncharacterized RDD family membrane protein YckC